MSKKSKGKEKMPTQNDFILDYMEKHITGITPQDALRICGCMRLSARISDLREMGYEIVTESETGKNKIGGRSTYARYKLVKGVK